MARIEHSGARIAQVPVSHYRRQYGCSQFFNIGRILETFAHYRHKYGMRSLAMGEVADIALGSPGRHDVVQHGVLASQVTR